MLKGKGCTGGPDKPSAGNNKIFSCPGVGKLSFRFSTTAGNQLRALTFEVIQRQLKSVGIELVPRFQPAGLSLRHDVAVERLGSHHVHVGRGAVVEDHGEGQARVRRRDQLRQLLQPRATELLDQTATELDENTRTKLLNQAEALMVKEFRPSPCSSGRLHDRREEAEGSDDPDDARRRPWNVEHLVGQLTSPAT